MIFDYEQQIILQQGIDIISAIKIKEGENELNIIAIETEYKGFKFRSRLEARWAVFFDAMDIIWEYGEPKKIGNKHIYLPDFYLPEKKSWIEISDKTPKAEDLRKCEAFAERQLKNNDIDFRLLVGDIPKATSDFGVIDLLLKNMTKPIKADREVSMFLNNLKGIKAYKLLPETKGRIFYGLWDDQPELGSTLMRTNWIIGDDYRKVERALNKAREAHF
ncbi:hypothetical protein QF028_003353 [Neobacillus sp. B4I6]|uniref:hypothetical protein n=1 Tax=Neobacillus sp. B4I6 TaxID=3373925 RepID=UPI003D20FADB